METMENTPKPVCERCGHYPGMVPEQIEWESVRTVQDMIDLLGMYPKDCRVVFYAQDGLYTLNKIKTYKKKYFNTSDRDVVVMDMYNDNEGW